MSAYVCNPAQFGLLAAAAALRRNVIWDWEGKDDIATVRKVAENLALENIRSVACRYSSTDKLPGLETGDKIVVLSAGDWAEYYYLNFPAVSDVELLKLCGNYAYQSCETNDWRDTLAYRQIDYIESDLIRRLPGYDAAPWGWDVSDITSPKSNRVTLVGGR